MIERTPAALLAALLLVASPRSARAQDEGPPTPEAVKEAIDAGDYDRAHALLTGLLLEQRLERAAGELADGEPEAAWKTLQSALELDPRAPRARALRSELAGVLLERWLGDARARLARGEPRDAMVSLDAAVALAPDDPEVLFLRGECTLRMGVEDGDPIAFDDAKRAFLAAAGSGTVPEAWSGAARALYQTYYDSARREDLDRALEFARRGKEETPEGSARAALMSSPPGRNYAEIAFTAYTIAKRAQDDPALVAQRFDESRAAFEALIGRAPQDPFAWRGLADLLAWEDRRDEARELLLRALAIAPDEGSLHEKLVENERARGGSDAVIATYREWTEARPEAALGHWWLGAESLERAIAALNGGDHECDAQFAAAEAEFARCAELAPQYAERCDGYRALCRAGVGWCHYHRGELDLARDAFLSMEDALEGGLKWEYPGKLPSGVQALGLVIGSYLERAVKDETPPEERDLALEHAADAGSFLRRYQPEDANAANDAGFLNRDAAVALEQAGEQRLRPLLARDANGESAIPGAQELRAGAAELFARARERMERSYEAYVAAAELAPDDARIQNDTGLVLVHYLQRDLERADAYLRRAVEIGSRQLDEGFEDADQEQAVIEAVGDACENLGVLALARRGDAAAAVPWFERSLEHAPTPRIIVEKWYLPICAAVAAGTVDVGRVQQASYWGALETERVIARIRAEEELRRLLPRPR